MRFENSNDNTIALIRVFGTIMVLMVGFMFYQNHTIGKVKEDININIPPDLSLGGSVKANEIPRTAVYDFGSRIFQSLHRWKINGATDYKTNIEQYSNFFTPEYKAFLLRDFDRRIKTGELRNRERGLQPLLNAWDYNLVKVINEQNGLATEWVIALDMELVETYQGEVVKRLYLRYPMHIVRRAVDTNTNPWGMALAGYASQPEPLKLEKEK